MSTNTNKSQDLFYIDEIARHLKDGRAAIMVGSGFSKNASPKFPDWRELGDKIFERLYNRKPENDKEHYLNPMRLAGELESVYGRSALDSIIKGIPDTFEPPSDVHIRLLELPWSDVFTTNYDTLLERAAVKVSARKYDTVISAEDWVCCSSPRIVKLHGSLPSNRPFVFTEDDFRKYPKENSVFVNAVQLSLVENVFCLIGFSGDDPNFLSWIGWGRDNVGIDYVPKIYLLNVGNEVSEPQRALLEYRNIITVNLQNIYGEKTTRELIIDLCKELREKSQDTTIQWNLGEFYYPPQTITTEVITQITTEWARQRDSYPGWVILPHRQRNLLWILTQYWGQLFRPDIFSTFSKDSQYAFTYELVWRLNKCLYPIDNSMLAQCEVMLRDEEWKVREPQKWYELILFMLRAYRITREVEKWKDLANIVQKNQSTFSDEQKSMFYYEKALDALFSLNTSNLRKTLNDWSEFKTVPLFEAKKAALWAEIGELDRAKTILDTSLATVREQINAAQQQDKVVLLSQEGCILSILRCVEFDKLAVESFTGNQGDFQEVIQKHEERNEFLRRYHCDLSEERLVFSTALKREPIPQNKSISQKDSFDIGIVTTSRNWNDGYNSEAMLGYSYLTFTEESGVPFKLTNADFDYKSAIGAAKRIKHQCFHWAFVTLLRTGNIESVDSFFDRHDMITMSQEDADYYAMLCVLVPAVSNLNDDLGKLQHPRVEKNLVAYFVQVIPEILSRLCVKCSVETLQKILDFVVAIYNLPENIRIPFRNVKNLVERLMNSYPPNRTMEIFDAVKKIDWKPANDPVVMAEFIDPCLSFLQHFKDLITAPTPEDIEYALQKLELPEYREIGISLCLQFHKYFNEEQKQRLLQTLWKEEYIDTDTGFPRSKSLLRYAFIVMPAPKEVDVPTLFRKLVLNNITNSDIFTGTSWTTTVNGRSVSLTEGWSLISQEWISGLGIFTFERLPLDITEVKILLDYIQNYWQHYKQYLDKNIDSPWMSVSGEFRKRFNTLLNVLSFVVIPNIVDVDLNETNDIKQKLNTLLNEMETTGLSVGTAKVASLAIFPERNYDVEQYLKRKFACLDKSNVNEIILGAWVLLVMKHKKLSFDLDMSRWVACIVDHIRFWLSPGLFSALQYIAIAIFEMPELFNEEILGDILPALGALADETNLANVNSRLTSSDRLMCRKNSMRLAFTIFKYYEQLNQEQPAEILTWKKIAESDNEFWEIKNQWGYSTQHNM